MCLSFLSSIFLSIRMILNTCFSTGLHIIRVWNHALLLVYSTYALKLYLYNNISNHSLEVFKSFIFNSGHNNIIGFEFIFEWFLSFFLSTWIIYLNVRKTCMDYIFTVICTWSVKSTCVFMNYYCIIKSFILTYWFSIVKWDIEFRDTPQL